MQFPACFNYDDVSIGPVEWFSDLFWVQDGRYFRAGVCVRIPDLARRGHRSVCYQHQQADQGGRSQRGADLAHSIRKKYLPL